MNISIFIVWPLWPRFFWRSLRRRFLPARPGLGDFNIFPDDMYEMGHSNYQVHPNSGSYLLGGRGHKLHPDFGTVYDGAPMGIPYVIVTLAQPLVPMVYTDYGDESDPGPFPVPLTASIEGGPASTGDRHVIVVDKDRKFLYELYYAFPKIDHWKPRAARCST